jgi:hypothetical protein
MAVLEKYEGLRLYLGRRLLTSYGGRANAAQGLRDVQRDQSERAEGDRALAHAEREAQAGRVPGQRARR